MGLFNGSAINSPETAFMFNQMATTESLPIWRRRCCGVAVLTGKPLEGDEHEGQFSNNERVDGRKVEVTINGTPRTLTGVADGAAERATANLVGVDGYGAMEFDIAHLKDILPIEESKVARYDGADTKKLSSFYDEMFKLAMASVEDTLEQMLFATGAGKGPSRTVVGSLNHAISDGVSAGETDYASYGTIDRTDAANIDFRSYVAQVPTLSLDDIGLASAFVSTRKGMTRAALAGMAVYQRVRALCEGMLDAEMDGDFIDFSGAKFRYAGITFMLGAYVTPQTLFGLDPDGFHTAQSNQPMTREGIVRDPSRVATYVMHYGPWFQFICKQINTQWKLTGIQK